MKKKGYSAPSVKKAFEIIQTIVDSTAGLGVSELSKQLKMSKSTVHGITSALEDLGVLVRGALRKKYTIGYALLELSRKSYNRIALRDIARTPMERLMEKVGETVFLGVMNGDHITILDVVESHHEMKITSPPGTRLPLLAGATGKVFLGQIEGRKAIEILQQIGSKRFTSKSVTDPKKFLKEAEEAKANGYAIDDEEYLLGVRAVASAIQAPSFAPSAIWVVGFTSSLDDLKMKNIIPEIQKTAQEISRSMNPA